MRKILTIIAGTIITGNLLAGGLVTNTNQSAAWVRMLSRNATVEVDAVYFNPAGVMQMKNGFHFGLNNQTISQKREITNSYSGPGGLYGLNQNTYEGKVFSWYFPSIYAVYKLERFAVSLGFTPIGGGGGAEYKKGLPSFEMGISDLVPGFASSGATAYDVDIYFKGSSNFLGLQGALAYKINDFLSIAAGARYVTASNSYSGHLQDVTVTMGGNPVLISDYLLGVAADLTEFIGVPSALAPALPTYGGLTLAQAQAGTIINADQRAGIEAGLRGAIGLTQAVIDGMTLNQVAGTISGATPAITPKIAEASATGRLTSNKSANVSQSGSGIAPFFSVNITPTENLNVSIKYEMATKLEMTNDTKEDLLVGFTASSDSITQFPDGEKFRSDMPAMLAVGVEYRIIPKLKIALGANYFFDKAADYGHKVDADLNPTTATVFIKNKDIIENNGMSIHGGVEYNLSDKFLVSAGYSYANKGVNARYQSDMTFANATNSIGLGGAYTFNDKIKINLGAGYTMYAEDSKSVDHMVKMGTTYVNFPATETYVKNTLIIGIGLDLSF